MSILNPRRQIKMADRFLEWMSGCGHPNQKMTETIVGVTMSWAALPTRLYRFDHNCPDCGMHWWTEGVLPCDQRLYPKAYNENGWPIDETGKPLPLTP